MRLRLTLHRFSGPAGPSRVIVPRWDLRGTRITRMLGEHIGSLTGTRADLLRLGALFRVAAVSPHTAVYLPLRTNRSSECDLLILRHGVHMRLSTWPAIRARLKHGTPLTMQAPAPRDPNPGRPSLVAREHAATVVLSGDAATLLTAGDELTWCGERVVRHRDIHRYGGPALLSQFNGDNDGGWECMILAEDRIFRRRGGVRRD